MRNIFILLIFTFLLSCTPPQAITYQPTADRSKIPTVSDGAYAQNIILLIGDGMGLSQITAGMYANGNKLALEQFKKIGFHKNYAYDDLITDSAAGATAFSCGVKTYNGAIGVGPDTLPRYTILEEAEDRGYMTGLITSSTIVHATPASFIAHNRQRRNYEEIALDFLKTDVDLFIGGGNKYFERREDEKNISQELKDKGYYISNYFEEELAEIDFKSYKKIGYLTSDSDPLSVEQGRDYLPSATQKALDFMDHHCEENQGFFLMIEGAQIDWGGHANKGNYITSEMIDFDQVINNVLHYTKKHPETLVIVTADHETGGLAINKGSTMNDLKMEFTSDYHTADLVPVFASGPQSDLFTGFYENTDIYQFMRTAFGWQQGSKL